MKNYSVTQQISVFVDDIKSIKDDIRSAKGLAVDLNSLIVGYHNVFGYKPTQEDILNGEIFIPRLINNVPYRREVELYNIWARRVQLNLKKVSVSGKAKLLDDLRSAICDLKYEIKED